MEEFGRIGFEGARVDRIAERCNVSKNMLYYYFKSKEGLFVAALERMYEGFRDQQRDLSVRASDPLLAMEQLEKELEAASDRLVIEAGGPALDPKASLPEKP